MDNIFQNYGLSHISMKIFDYLDYKSLCKARLVSKAWKDLIDHISIEKRNEWHLVWLFKSKQWFLREWPEWKNILMDFIHNRTSEEVKTLFKMLDKYFYSYSTLMNKLDDPLMLAIGLRNVMAHVKLILPSVKNLNYQNREGRTILHQAVIYGRLAIVKLLLDYSQRIDFKMKDKHGRTTQDEARIQILLRGGEIRKTKSDLITKAISDKYSTITTKEL